MKADPEVQMEEVFQKEADEILLTATPSSCRLRNVS
jgi:hypothetical protein